MYKTVGQLRYRRLWDAIDLYGRNGVHGGCGFCLWDGAQKTMIAKQTASHIDTVFHQAFPSGEGGMAKP